jgi:hypothetical protein
VAWLGAARQGFIMGNSLLILWLLLDNAELVVHACLYGVAAVAWCVAGVLTLMLTWGIKLSR